jgi:hypothetical protein
MYEWFTYQADEVLRYSFHIAPGILYAGEFTLDDNDPDDDMPLINLHKKKIHWKFGQSNWYSTVYIYI